MQEHPPQDSGGYWRSLKKKEDSKGFTLVELIVVIVILAILAAILIPGLLKWIDQAKDKKYELEAREIAMAAEAALTKAYAQGAGALDLVEKDGHYLLKAGGSTDLIGFLGEEIEKFTDAAVEVDKIEIYGNPDDSAPGKWGGSATGFEITFKASDDAEITASLLPGSDRWVINKLSGESGEDPNEDPKVLTAQKIVEAAKAALRKCDEQDAAVTCDDQGRVCVDGQNNIIVNNLFKKEIKNLLPEDVQMLLEVHIKGKEWLAGNPKLTEEPWDGSSHCIIVHYLDSDNVERAALYSPADGWECIDETEDEAEFRRKYFEEWENYYYFGQPLV